MSHTTIYVEPGEGRVECSEWVSRCDGRPVTLPADGVLCEVRRGDGTRAAVFRVEHRPLLEITFDSQGSAVQTYRTFKYVRDTVTRVVAAPMILVREDSPLKAYAERLMAPCHGQVYDLR